ncbi:hypothetical protein [Myroides odoratimimus]
MEQKKSSTRLSLNETKSKKKTQETINNKSLTAFRGATSTQ